MRRLTENDKLLVILSLVNVVLACCIFSFQSRIALLVFLTLNLIILTIFISTNQKFNRETKWLTRKLFRSRAFLHRIVDKRLDDMRVYEALLRQEKALRKQAEVKCRLLADNALEMIWMLSLDGRLLYISPAVESIMGYTKQEALRLPLEKFLSPRSALRSRERLSTLPERLALGIYEEFDEDLELIRKDGTKFWGAVRSRVLFDEEGKPTAIQGNTIDISVRKEFERQIQTALYEKESLLREVNHRVKNNMQVITSIVSLQSANVKDGYSPSYSTNLQARIRSMAFVHQCIYNSEDFNYIDFKKYINNTANYLFQAYHVSSSNVALVVDVEDRVAIDLNHAVTLGLVINELVTNTLKHAFYDDRKGTLKISLRYCEFERQHQLIILDSGEGLKGDLPELKRNAFGLRLVDMLLSQLRGTIDMQNNNGLEVKVSFDGAPKKTSSYKSKDKLNVMT